MRLSKLSQIDVAQIARDAVGLGSAVTVEDEKTGKQEVYNLVFGDVDFEEGHVSMSSPIGRSLVGKKLGDAIILRLPASVRHLKIVEIKTIHDIAG